MGVKEDIEAAQREYERQLYEQGYGQYRSAVQSGSVSYDKAGMADLAKKGGVNVSPPTPMPLPPDMTRTADRQSMARRRRRGRSSTMLTSTLGEETLG